MDSVSLMDVYQSKTLIKHLIKSILRRVGQQKQLFYGLSALLSTPVCFSRQQLKWKKPSLQMRFYVVYARYMTGVSLCLHRCCSLFDSVANDRDHKPLLKHDRMSTVERLYKVDFMSADILLC